MTKIDSISDLGPGDKFLYKDTYYIVVGIDLSEGFSLSMTDRAYCLNLDTYTIEPFYKDTDVEVIYYYGGL